MEGIKNLILLVVNMGCITAGAVRRRCYGKLSLLG
jgi:hypothetical protein